MAFRMGHVVTCLETLRLLVTGPIFLDLDLSLASVSLIFWDQLRAFLIPSSGDSSLQTAECRDSMKARVSDREERKLPEALGTIWAEICSHFPTSRVIVI